MYGGIGQRLVGEQGLDAESVRGREQQVRNRAVAQAKPQRATVLHGKVLQAVAVEVATGSGRQVRVRDARIEQRCDAVAARQRDLPGLRAAQQQIVASVRVPVVDLQIGIPGPRGSLQLRRRAECRAGAEADAKVARDVLVGVVGAVVIVEIEGDQAGERRVEAVVRIAGRGDACDRVVLVHEEVFRAVAVEVDARADELAALGVHVGHRRPLRIQGHRRAEAARRQRVADVNLEVVVVRGRRYRPDEIAEPVAVQVGSADVPQVRRHGYARVDRGQKAGGASKGDGEPAVRGAQQEILTPVAVRIEGRTDTLPGGDAGIDRRTERTVADAQPVMHRRGVDAAAARPQQVAPAITADVDQAPAGTAGHDVARGHRDRSAGELGQGRETCLPLECRRREAIGPAGAAFAQRREAASTAGRQRRFIGELVAAQNGIVVQHVDADQADHLPDGHSGHEAGIDVLVGPVFVSEHDLVRHGRAIRRIRAIAHARDPVGCARRLFGVLEIDDVAGTVARAVERPAARAAGGRALYAVDSRIVRGAVLVDEAVGGLDRERRRAIGRVALDGADPRERLDLGPVFRIRGGVT